MTGQTPAVESGTRDAIAIEMEYPHPPARVWQALTDSTALARWLMPNDFAPRLGHEFSFRVDKAGGWSGVVRCRVVALEAPRLMAYTWSGGSPLPETLVTFTLEPTAAGTRLRLVHSGFAAGGLPALSVRDLLAGGWNSTLLRERLPALLDALRSEES